MAKDANGLAMDSTSKCGQRLPNTAQWWRGLRCSLAVVVAFLFLPGCNALNPLCGSARPAPVIGSLSASSITFADVQQGYILTVTGKNFVAATVVVINGTALGTTVQSSTSLQVTITSDLITGPGSASVTVNTPAGNSQYEGCTSGGTSSALTLTIT